MSKWQCPNCSEWQKPGRRKCQTWNSRTPRPVTQAEARGEQNLWSCSCGYVRNFAGRTACRSFGMPRQECGQQLAPQQQWSYGGYQQQQSWQSWQPPQPTQPLLQHPVPVPGPVGVPNAEHVPQQQQVKAECAQQLGPGAVQVDEEAIRLAIGQLDSRIAKLQACKDDEEVAALLAKRVQDRENLLQKLRSQKPVAFQLKKVTKQRDEQAKAVTQLEAEEAEMVKAAEAAAAAAAAALQVKRDAILAAKLVLSDLRAEAAKLAEQQRQEAVAEAGGSGERAASPQVLARELRASLAAAGQTAELEAFDEFLRTRPDRSPVKEAVPVPRSAASSSTAQSPQPQTPMVQSSAPLQNPTGAPVVCVGSDDEGMDVDQRAERPVDQDPYAGGVREESVERDGGPGTARARSRSRSDRGL